MYAYFSGFRLFLPPGKAATAFCPIRIQEIKYKDVEI